MIPYAMKGNKKCPIVITKADLSASSKDNNAPVVGAVVRSSKSKPVELSISFGLTASSLSSVKMHENAISVPDVASESGR